MMDNREVCSLCQKFCCPLTLTERGNDGKRVTIVSEDSPLPLADESISSSEKAALVNIDVFTDVAMSVSCNDVESNDRVDDQNISIEPYDGDIRSRLWL